VTCRWHTMACSSWMHGPSSAAMSSRCSASRSRRVFSADNLPHVLNLHTLAEFARRMMPKRSVDRPVVVSV
jgi:hypothetical protein